MQALTDNGLNKIVDTQHQLYSYDEMLNDLDSLGLKFPECIRYRFGNTKTCQQRQIPIVFLGDSSSSRHVMVQASIHAREYMTSQLVMAMLEKYACCYYENVMYKDKTIRELFDSVCFVIIPMVNPDGVEIAQHGETGAATDDVKSWIKEMSEKGFSYTHIKSNANGVDLNRNFKNGFANPKVKGACKNKSYSGYMGPYPYSEIETKLMLAVSDLFDYSLFLNYHTSGNVIFYGCMNACSYVNDEAHKISKIIQRHTSYPLLGPLSAVPSGSWADEVELLYKRPSVTIEIGSKNPVPIYEFENIFNKNQWIWADIAWNMLKGNCESL